MGGLAIKKVIGREGDRFTPLEYKKYRILLCVPDFYTLFPREIEEKESYGDIDLLLSNEHNVEDYKREVIRRFELVEIKYQGETINGRTHSLAIGDKQIDISVIPFSEMVIANEYFSNNDLGNLLGRIANTIGMKFGHNGLFWIEREGDQVLGEFLISNEIETVLEILGFDRDAIKYYLTIKDRCQGFSTYESMYEFVTKSKYFDGTKYRLENLNQENRIRNKKRNTYMNFLEWINNNGLINKTPDIIIPKRIMLDAVLKEASGNKYVDFLLAIEDSKYASAKFNGLIVMQLVPNLFGKELGEFIAKFKMAHPDYLNYTTDQINNCILELGETWKI